MSRCPDGGVVLPLDRARPLRSLGLLVQEDFCILQKNPKGRMNMC